MSFKKGDLVYISEKDPDFYGWSEEQTNIVGDGIPRKIEELSCNFCKIKTPSKNGYLNLWYPKKSLKPVPNKGPSDISIVSFFNSYEKIQKKWIAENNIKAGDWVSLVTLPHTTDIWAGPPNFDYKKWTNLKIKLPTNFETRHGIKLPYGPSVPFYCLEKTEEPESLKSPMEQINQQKLACSITKKACTDSPADESKSNCLASVSKDSVRTSSVGSSSRRSDMSSSYYERTKTPEKEEVFTEAERSLMKRLASAPFKLAGKVAKHQWGYWVVDPAKTVLSKVRYVVMTAALTSAAGLAGYSYFVDSDFLMSMLPSVTIEAPEILK